MQLSLGIAFSYVLILVTPEDRDTTFNSSRLLQNNSQNENGVSFIAKTGKNN